MNKKENSKRKTESRNLGFSMLEIIVVITLMAVLGTILAPMFFRYVSRNRMTACQTGREAILAVFERCVYAETKQVSQSDLEAILKAEDAATADEIHQYDKCPMGGSYTAELDGDTAIIHCDIPEHEDVLVILGGWSGTEWAEGDDAALPSPPPYWDPDSEPPAEEGGEGTGEDKEDDEDAIWPYATDSRWDGKRFPGQYVEVDVPVMFTSDDKNNYVLIDKDGTGKGKVYWEWNLGPEKVDAKGRDWCISWSGVTIEDISGIKYYEQQNGVDVDTGCVTGVHRGDIIIYEGARYIYTLESSTLKQPLPPVGASGNGFYLIDKK